MGDTNNIIESLTNVQSNVVGSIENIQNNILFTLNKLSEQVTPDSISNKITFLLNQKEITIENPDPEERLLYYLREDLNLYATKPNCNQGFCGNCMVMVTEKTNYGKYKNLNINSCLLRVVDCNGKSITTLEGINPKENDLNAKLHPIQEHFYVINALQCGYCIPGQIMTMYSTLQDLEKLPTFHTVENVLAGNLCRCTGYRPIIEAYKTLLIAVVEGDNGVSKDTVIGNIHTDVYEKQYSELKDKWNIGKTGGLPVYNVKSFNINNENNDLITNYLDTFKFQRSLYTSNVFGGYKYHVPTSLQELNEIVSKIDKKDKIIFLGSRTSYGVPSYSEYTHKYNEQICLDNITEFHNITVSSSGDYIFGSNVTQNLFQETLLSSNDLKYNEIANAINNIASYSIRNTASCVASSIMTIKNGFRGDWATFLSASNCIYEYTIYTEKENINKSELYEQLKIDMNLYGNVVLVKSIHLPSLRDSEDFKIYRSAKRPAHAQSYSNVCVSTLNGVSNFVIGAVNNVGLQYLVSDSLITALNNCESLNIEDEYEFLNKESNIENVRNIIKGFIVKYYGNLNYDIKKSKITCIGNQTYNSGDVNNTVDDYSIWSLDDKSHKHKMAKEGAKLQQISTRDQIGDFTTIGTQFNEVGKLGPITKKSYYRVQGESAYATELPMDNYKLEYIVSNIAKGKTDYNSAHNQALLTKIRNYENVECLLVNDIWFTENIGNLGKDGKEPRVQQGFGDHVSQAANNFNNFQPLFNSWGSSTYFTDTITSKSGRSIFSTNIRENGDLIGCILTNSVELSRELAKTLSEQLIHISEEPALKLVDEVGQFKPNDVLNDSNTLNREYSSIFTKQFGRYTGITKDTPNNPDYEKYLSPGDEWLGETYKHTYKMNETNGATDLVPNSENDKKCPFWASGDFVDTLGGGYNSGTGTGQPITGEANKWMDSNYDKWYNTTCDYSGTVKSNSQYVAPMEGISFTVFVKSTNVIKLYIGSQDSFVFTYLSQILKNVDPKYQIKMFDENGNYINPEKEGFKLEVEQMASGGSFGYKYYYSTTTRLEGAILTAMITRKSIKYMEYWENSESYFLGRYLMYNLSTMSIDKVNNKISHLANDTYTLGNKNSIFIGIAAATISDVLTNWQKIDNYATRNTLVNLNISQTQAQRGFGQTEGCALLHSLYSKGSALLGISHMELLLNHVTSVEDRLADTSYPAGFGITPTDSGRLYTSNPGFPNTVTSLNENIWKELEIAILKNLQNKRYPDDYSTNYIESISDLQSIKNSYKNYYRDNVENFNNLHKFKKRGMSLVPYAYKILNNFNNNITTKVCIDMNSRRINYDVFLVDHGTGSFLKGASVLADCLKVDIDLINYISTNKSASAGSLGHAGSTGVVQQARSSLDAGNKFLEAILERYPLNPFYAGLVDPALAAPARNYTVTCANKVNGDTESATVTLSTGVTLKNGDTIDLKTISGKDVMVLYNAAFPNKSLRSMNILGLYDNPEALHTNPGDLTTNPGPDLHREIIIRTLESEYSISSAGPVQGYFVFQIDYYLDLVDSSRKTYITEVTKTHMMNRWPMICCFVGTAILDSDAGSASHNLWGPGPVSNCMPTAVFAAAGVLPPEFSGAGSMFFGNSNGGIKVLPLEPNNECGKPSKVYDGSVVTNCFGSTITTCDVVGRTIQDPHWTIDYGSNLTGFEVTAVYNMCMVLSEIDVLTGEWKNIRTEMIANTDRSINGLIDINQMEGGFHMGSGYVTSEDSSEMLTNGKLMRQGHWNYKIPIAQNTPEMFNASLLNVDNAYQEGPPFMKGVAEINTPTSAGAMGASLRDCIRNFRQDTSVLLNGSNLTNPFSSDSDTTDRTSCSYMDDLFQVSVDKIKKHTSVPNDVIEYLLNN